MDPRETNAVIAALTPSSAARLLRGTIGALALLAILLLAPQAVHAQGIAYGSINNFDCVNDTGSEAHGFEIEIDDVHSTDITYTYDWNHYGVPDIREDNSDPLHPKVFIRYAAKRNPDGSWSAYTAIPSGPILPTDGHQFTDPSVNFGGEHYGVGYYGSPTAVKYNWLVDNGAGILVHGPPVMVATPTFTYYPPAGGGNPQVVPAVVPPPPPAPPVLRFGEPIWVKDIKTTTHNANKVRLRDLVDPDPDHPEARNWANGEPDEVETEWRMLQTEFGNDGNPKGRLEGLPEDMPGGDEVITRRYEFFKYGGAANTIDGENGEAMCDEVNSTTDPNNPLYLHGKGTSVEVADANGDSHTVNCQAQVVVGDFIGAQMAGFDVAPGFALIDHLPDGEKDVQYADRTMVVGAGADLVATVTGSLPPGTAVDEATGIFYGTPTVGGTFTFTVSATDASAVLISKEYTVTVAGDGPVGGECAAGTYSANGLDSPDACTLASVGHYVDAPGSTSETACAPGSFQPLEGATSCDLASTGHFVEGSGAAEQTECAPGSYQDLTGQTSCTLAAAGHYVAGSAATTQSACAVGSYQDLTGQTSCKSAAAGSYVSEAGASAQTKCAAGTASYPGASACSSAATSDGTLGNLATYFPDDWHNFYINTDSGILYSQYSNYPWEVVNDAPRRVMAQTGAPDALVLDFADASVPANVWIWTIGSRPLVVLSTAAVTVAGNINRLRSGEDEANGRCMYCGGATPAGGGAGSGSPASSATNTAGSAGPSGVFIGTPGLPAPGWDVLGAGGGGGGGGWATGSTGHAGVLATGVSGSGTNPGGAGGSPTGGDAFQGGGGGGAGGSTNAWGDWAGGAGGNGGAAIWFKTPEAFTVTSTGQVHADGDRGFYADGYAGGGGGGGGGQLRFTVGGNWTNDGIVSAAGGGEGPNIAWADRPSTSDGGAGGGGLVRVAAACIGGVHAPTTGGGAFEKTASSPTGCAPAIPSTPVATAGNGTVSVAFDAPFTDGGSTITGYTATCGAYTGSKSSAPFSPVSVTVPNGTAVTCTVHATNSVGNGPESAASNSVTPVGKPVVVTNAATSVSLTGAVLGGTVNPSGLATSGHFEYGLSVSYGTSTASQDLGSGGSPASLDGGAISGLVCGMVYHFRAVATNSAGTTNGSDRAFSTLACPTGPAIHSFTASNTVVSAGGLSTLSWTAEAGASLTLNGAPVSGPTGSQNVYPSVTTTYTLVASNLSGSTSRLVTVQVNDGSAPLAAPTITAPTASQVVVVTGVGFSWTVVAGASAYDLRIVDASTGSLLFSGSLIGGSSTNALVTLSVGSYRFAVRACTDGLDATQCGPFATRNFSVSPAGPESAPTITFPTQGANLTSSTQTLSWTPVTPNPLLPDLAYEVLLRDLDTLTTALQITVPAPATSTIFTMGTSTQYELKVRACQAGCGPWSTPVTFAVSLPNVPTVAPSISSCVVANGNSLTCNWSAVSNADTYQVLVVQPSGGPGGGALAVAATLVSTLTVTLPVPVGAATVLVAGCNGDGCGPNAFAEITVTGVNPSLPNLGTPMAGSVVDGPTVLFTWNRIPGDNGSNTVYRLYVQDLSRQSAAFDVYTTQNFYAAYFRAEGARYDAIVIANPGPDQVVGPASGFNVAGASATAPTMVAPAHNSTVSAGNIQLAWSPVPGATLYEYFVAVQGQPDATVRGVTPGLLAQVPLTGSGLGTVYSGIVRACPAGATCAAGADAGWGPWSVNGGPGVTNFTVIP